MKMSTILILVLMIPVLFLSACNDGAPDSGKVSQDTPDDMDHDKIIQDSVSDELIGEDDFVEIGEMI